MAVVVTARVPLQSLVMRRVVPLEPQSSIKDVIKKMHDEGASCLVQLDDDHRPVAYIEEHDVIRAVAEGTDGLNRSARNYTKRPIQADVLTDLREAASLLIGRGVRDLVIVDEEGRAVGIEGVREVAYLLPTLVPSYLNMPISSLTRRNIVTYTERETLREVAQRMAALNIGSLLEVQDGRIQSFLTTKDIIAAISTDVDPSTAKARDYASYAPIVATPDMRIIEVSKLMRANLVHHLPVVDSEYRPLGLISSTDLSSFVVATPTTFLRAHVLVKTVTGEEDAVLAQLRSLPDVTRAEAIVGPYDIYVEVIAASRADLGTSLMASIRKIKGVIDTVTCIPVA
ncbi:MAG: CBS domain-containing protein [Candidatus Methanosuratus sp.]|nr:CBS domain-containing protein [Candidatus Methanosuratincola sp.]